MANELSQVRFDNWVSMIRNQKASGLTVVEWCKENNVTENSYYYWLRKIRTAALNAVKPAEEDPDEERAEFAKLELPSENQELPSCQDPDNRTAFKIHRGDLVVEVSNDASDRILRFLEGTVLSC